MAKIVNKSQPVIVGAVSPASVYSRVVSCKQNYMAPLDWYGMWTQPIGQSFWLLGIDVWLSVFTPNGSLYHRLDFRTGFGKPANVLDLENWELLLPFYDGALAGDFELYSSRAHMHWDMKMRFEGINRRLGLRVYVGSGTHTAVNASFRISEG